MAAEALPGFRFESRACPGIRFRVVGFEGEERLGRCYRFRVDLVCEGPGPDLEVLTGSQACFSILRQAGSGRADLPFHGVLVEFCLRYRAGPLTFCEAVLVPRLQLLALTRHHQVFLDQTLPEFIAACLEDGGLAPGDFRFALARDPADWEKRDFVCQCGESHLDFVQRWLEREGLYYFFEQRDGGERLVITDSRVAHQPRAGEPEVRYQPVSGLAGGHREDVVTRFGGGRDLAPLKVDLADTGDLAFPGGVQGEAQVEGRGHGVVASFGGHLRTPGEARRLAGLRAEAEKCRETLFEGSGCVPFLQAGHLFRLRGHFRAVWDGEYLIVEIRHRGGQAGSMLAGPGRDPAPAELEPRYENWFTALPAAVQFRPSRTASGPRIHGVLPAVVDAEGSGVHLDEWSRYKVVLPFDQSGRGGGKASAWVRMLGPYAGAGHGWNSPLHKGTEVLLGFVDGDPDRPVITGAVPNPRTPSPVNADNASQVVLRTAGGNRLAFEDQPGRESICLDCHNQGATFQVGPLGSSGPGSASLSTANGWEVSAGSKTEVVVGNSSSFINGIATAVQFGVTTFVHLGAYLHVSLLAGAAYEGPDKFNYSPGHARFHNLKAGVINDSEDFSKKETEVNLKSENLFDFINESNGKLTRMANSEKTLGSLRDNYSKTMKNFNNSIGISGQTASFTSEISNDWSKKSAQMVAEVNAKIENCILKDNEARASHGLVQIKAESMTSNTGQETVVTDQLTYKPGS